MIAVLLIKKRTCITPLNWFNFFRFNKKLEMPTFSDAEYHNHLMVEGWTRPETDHLIDLCGRFDLRFPIIHDRWDKQVRHRFSLIQQLFLATYNKIRIQLSVLAFRKGGIRTFWCVRPIKYTSNSILFRKWPRTAGFENKLCLCSRCFSYKQRQ